MPDHGPASTNAAAGISVPAVLPIAGFNLLLGDGHWRFAEERRDEIAAHWRRRLAEAPGMWDGEVLLVQSAELRGDVLHGTLITVRFSAHLAWRDWGRPDTGVTHVFGSCVVRGSDGALVLGKMADDTANAGAVYPSSGMLDSRDVGPDGRADVFASIARELMEEMGLCVADGTIAEDVLMRDGAMMSVNRILDFPAPAEELAARVRQTLSQQAERELADVVVIRTAEDIVAAGVHDHWTPVLLRALGAA